MPKKPWTPYTDYAKRKEKTQKVKESHVEQKEKERKTICDGVEIQPISKKELAHRLAKQRAQGHGIGLSGLNDIAEAPSKSKVIPYEIKKKDAPPNRLIAQIESKYGKLKNN